MEIWVLIGFVLFFVPFVMPIITWLKLRSARQRVTALEDAMAEQARTLDALKGQLAQLRRETRVADAAPASDATDRVPAFRPATPVHPATDAVEKAPAVLRTPAPPTIRAPQVTVPPPPKEPKVEPSPAASRSPAPPVPSGPGEVKVPPPLRPDAATPPQPPKPPTVLPPPPPVEEPRQPFDWEQLAGAKLFPALAGITLVLGAIFFLRYSIESGWLQPPVRVLIGIVVAVGLLVVCELKAARNYPSLANALDAAAIAILFATFFAAHALWDLIPGGITFVLLAIVAALAVLLSIRRESLFIAVLGLLGGFATPILLSTGENRPIPLFAYLLLLNVGLAWVAYRNTWPILTVLTLVFTTLYQWGWVFRYLNDAADLPLAMAIFLVFPVVTFAGVLLRRTARDGSASPAFERTAFAAALVPVAFVVFLAAIPAYGARASLLFGFLLVVDIGLLAVSLARRQMVLHTIGAGSTLLAMGVWLALSYFGDARLVVLGFTVAFAALFLAAEPLAVRWGATSTPTVGRYAAPLLMFVLPALASLEPAFSDARLLFAVQLLVLVACAWRAVATRDGYLYYIAAFFSVAGQAVWSVEHLSPGSLRQAVAIYGIFGVVSILVPLIARRSGRELQPAGGGGIVLLASLGLLLYLSAGPIALTTLWALALLLAILNAGLFVESAGARLPAVAIVGSLLSWIVLAAWWFRSAGSVGVLPSLSVLIGLTLITLAGHAWTNARLERRPATSLGDAAARLFTSGLFLGLAGHLFLYLLALNREWSLPPWPLFGALVVITLAATAAALHTGTSVLHAAAVAGAAAIITGWATVATAAPWPLVALVAGAATSGYALLWLRPWRARGDEEIPAIGAAVALFIGEITAMMSVVGSPPPVYALIAAHAANLVAILALTWARRWTWTSIGAAAVAWIAVTDWRGPWTDQLAVTSVLYLIVLAYPLMLGRRVGARRDPHIAAVVASAMFFFAGRQALERGGYDWMIGVIPVVSAIGLAVLLRQLLRNEVSTERDQGRLALVAGAALGFVTVAIPLQLEHQWITIGWALEGAALAWLFTRIPHRGLLMFSVALLAAVFARLALNPEVFRYEPRGELRIFNWYLYTYVIAALAFLVSARWLWRSDDGLAGGKLRPSRLLPGAAVVLLFLLVNIEIADYYATGAEIVFRFGAGVSQDLTYTISWLIFGLLLLAAGIYAHARPARIAAVALIAFTAFKCFLYDLASLGGLYRVGSFVGLGISLALVSLVLQKYVLARPKEAK